MSTEIISGQLGMATPYHELIGRSDAELEAEFADYAALGVSWIRTDFYWGLIEPVKDAGYNWGKLDKVVALAEKYGIEVLGLLNGKPSWASAGLAAASDAVAFGKFAKAAAEHFGDRVDAWEILNETNINGISAASYTALLKAAYTAIKSVDAGDVVVTAGLSPVPSTTGSLVGAVQYLNQMYASGAKGFFDAVGFHPYSWPLMPDDPKAWNGWQIMEDGVRAAMIANGDGDLKVWITEMGAPTAGGANAVTNAQLVEILTQSTALAKGYDWAGPLLWYAYQDRGGSTSDTENWFGLIGPDGAKKPAYYLFQELATKDDAVLPTFGGAVYWGDQTANVIVGNDLDNIVMAHDGDDAISGGKGDDLLLGGRGNDAIGGGDGDDRIAGGAGNDVLSGGAGKDVFVFEGAPGNDTIVDFEKGDLIDLSLMDANAALAGVQPFTFVGSKWLSKAGDLGVYIDATNDRTFVQAEINGDGKFDVSIVLRGKHALTADDFLLAAVAETPSFKSSNFTGTSGNDVLIGNARANVIGGMEGDDVLKGGDGDDVLVGHKGDDILWGEAGNDRFDFNDSRFFGRDVIMDFQKGDKIDLSDVDANLELAGVQEFRFVGSAWLSKAGDLGVYQDASRGMTVIQGYTDGDGKFDFSITLNGVIAITADDLLL